VESLLDALVASGVGQREHLVAQITVVGHEDAAPVEKQPVVRAPGRLQLAGRQLLLQQLRISRRHSRAADVIDEGEGGARDGARTGAPFLARVGH